MVDALKALDRAANGEGRVGEYQKSGWKIRDNMGLAPSIDNFMHTHQADSKLVEFGKVAILRCIARAELGSSLFSSVNEAGTAALPRRIGDTWLGRLFQRLVSGRDAEEFLATLSKVTFVCFNYDRCIERFFSIAVPSYFGPQYGSRLNEALRVIHPYGVIGDYDLSNPWVLSGRDGSKAQPDVNLSDAPARIQTFTEGADSGVVDEIAKHFSTSRMAVFLGFGYHKLNLKLFDLPKRSSVRDVIASCYEESESNISDIKDELGRLLFVDDSRGSDQLSRPITMYKATASDVISDFSRLIDRSLLP
ncbi:hypothetical protein ACK8OR_09235 [Jannaschia sp. KMU-145]|uniref:hypothetical protein n=1 Tax=Jannaschia halovivens TaxID=3388667 RepID=UPI00396B2BD6